MGRLPPRVVNRRRTPQRRLCDLIRRDDDRARRNGARDTRPDAGQQRRRPLQLPDAAQRAQRASRPCRKAHRIARAAARRHRRLHARLHDVQRRCKRRRKRARHAPCRHVCPKHVRDRRRRHALPVRVPARRRQQRLADRLHRAPVKCSERHVARERRTQTGKERRAGRSARKRGTPRHRASSRLLARADELDRRGHRHSDAARRHACERWRQRARRRPHRALQVVVQRHVDPVHGDAVRHRGVNAAPQRMQALLAYNTPQHAERARL
mmetsp:Transcript_33375/g.99392  ORF Transcript_33375/g.99392 Transcript_33375/m.99392 type:complete len:268 (-) Transcript_33375:1200-2003(-)